MIAFEGITPQQMEERAQAAGVALPIEQTAAWAAFQADVTGRTPWGALAVTRGGETVAFLSLIDYETHGYHYLRSTHGPVWVGDRPDAALEREFVEALVAYVRKRDGKVAFLRIDLWEETGTFPVLSTVPYDETVVVSLEGGDDEILARMKKRGRRDVRKALRESPAECAEETARAAEDFAEYYDVMVETAARDGFAPAPASDYTDMLRALGPEHARLFAARIDGRVVAWSIVTVNGPRAVYYYACSGTEVRRELVPDKLLYAICCALSAEGCEAIDLMGIGNDFAPSLKSLNTFKTKFAEGTSPVAPGRDVPVKRGFYAALRTAQKVRKALRK